MPGFRHDARTKAILNRTIRDVPDQPDPLISARSLTRGTTITGLMLEDLGTGRGGWKRPSVALSRFGQVAWGLVELAAPRSLGQVLFQYWIALAFALAVLMILIGVVTGTGPVTNAGYLVLAVSVVAYVVVEKMRRWMISRDIGQLRPALLLIPLGIAVLGAFGVLKEMNSLDVEMRKSGARYEAMSQHAGELRTPEDARAILSAKQVQVQDMTASLGWDSLFILCYGIAFLSLGWMIATQFDRPYRAFVWVFFPTMIAVVSDASENLQAYLAIHGRQWMAPIYVSDLKIHAAEFTVAILLVQVIVLRVEHRAR